MKKIVLAMLAFVSSFVMISAVAGPVFAENELTKKGCELAETEEQKAALGCDQNAQVSSVAKNLINAVISILGIVSVIVLIFAGQRYISSNGDPGKATQARNMIIAAIVGLIVAIVAFSVVNFILSSIFE